MKKFLIVSVLIVVFCVSKTTFSQTDGVKPIKNYLTTNILKPIRSEYTLRYERLITLRDFIRFDIGYKNPRNNDSYENKMTVLIKTTNKWTIVSSYTFSVGYGRFLIQQTGFYLAIDLSYRYNYYDHKYYYDCVGTSSDSYVYLESEFNDNFGIRPQVGYKLAVNHKNRIRFVIDGYIGYGFYYNVQKYILYGQDHGSCSLTYFQYLPAPEETNSSSLKVPFIFGVNIGMGF